MTINYERLARWLAFLEPERCEFKSDDAPSNSRWDLYELEYDRWVLRVISSADDVDLKFRTHDPILFAFIVRCVQAQGWELQLWSSRSWTEVTVKPISVDSRVHKGIDPDFMGVAAARAYLAARGVPDWESKDPEVMG